MPCALSFDRKSKEFSSVAGKSSDFAALLKTQPLKRSAVLFHVDHKQILDVLGRSCKNYIKIEITYMCKTIGKRQNSEVRKGSYWKSVACTYVPVHWR